MLLVLKIGTILLFINFPQNIFFADITKAALENFTNQTRQSMGFSVLVENQKLNQAAQLKAENMVQNQYFSHTSPQGLTPWHWFLQAGYNYKYAGENLAVGFYDSEEVYNAWLNSPSHRANLLNPNYKEVGTAILKGIGQNNAIVVVQLFGSQKIQAAPTVQTAPAGDKNSLNVNNEEVIVESPEVLSQSTQIPTTQIQSDNSGISYDFNYNGWLDDVIYGISFMVIGILAAILFFSFNGVSFKKELVLRSLIVVILLSLATLLNKELVISIIPHQMII